MKAIILTEETAYTLDKAITAYLTGKKKSLLRGRRNKGLKTTEDRVYEHKVLVIDVEPNQIDWVGSITFKARDTPARRQPKPIIDEEEGEHLVVPELEELNLQELGFKLSRLKMGRSSSSSEEELSD